MKRMVLMGNSRLIDQLCRSAAYEENVAIEKIEYLRLLEGMQLWLSSSLL